MSKFGNSFHAFAVEKIPLIQMGQDIVEPIIRALDDMNETLQENDIVIITSKIISKSENRLVDLRDVEPSKKAKEIGKKTDIDPRRVELTLQQGKLLGFGNRTILIENDLGLIMENAGIDNGNFKNTEARDLVLLLPSDPDKSARNIRQKFKTHYNTNIGVLIQDSSRRAWRNGHIGLAIGSSGIKMLDVVYEDPIRKFDLYGVPTRVSQVNVGDQIASIGNLLMGETSDGLPVIIIRGLHAGDEMETSEILRNSIIRHHENNELEKSSIFVQTSPNSFYRKPTS